MIYKHAEVEWVAAAWLLERMHPDEFSLVQKVKTELTGKDGGAVKTEASGVMIYVPDNGRMEVANNSQN